MILLLITTEKGGNVKQEKEKKIPCEKVWLFGCKFLGVLRSFQFLFLTNICFSSQFETRIFGFLLNL